MKPKDPQFVHPKGDYRLNQTVAKFGDRRTKRKRDRSANKRDAIQRSVED